MKIFIYKTLFVTFCLFVLVLLSINITINRFDKKIGEITSKENIFLLKQKIRAEMNIALNKDPYLDPEDSKLIGQFIKKIAYEIDSQK